MSLVHRSSPDAPDDHLPRLRRELAREYGDHVPDEVIDLTAQEALGEFSHVRIRDFVPVFAWRRARARLRDHVVRDA